MEIRSYRRVFDLERRIYRVDRLRLNPGGLPVRGIVYFLAILSASLIAGGLPLLGALVRALPWYLRDLALPGASAAVLSVIRVEGRPFHLAALALVRYRTGPRRLAGLRPCEAAGARWRADDIVILPDGSDGRMRRLRYTGPGAVLVAVEHERAGRLTERGATGVARRGSRRVLTVRELPQARPLSAGLVISLGRGARLLVRGKARPGRGRR
ncbi:MAG TPA: hypothetical protein VES97_12340 [Solirubrobacteraceae bacterium]|nr:hypothetical protein [Solirubrobacteraceae bacterium]